MVTVDTKPRSIEISKEDFDEFIKEKTGVDISDYNFDEIETDADDNMTIYLA